MPGFKENRTIVIMGSTSGIGAAIACQFARPNTSILLHGKRNLAGLYKTALLARESGASVRCVLHDLTRPETLKSMVDMAFNWNGRVDTWINAAGADVLTGSNRALSFEEKLDLLWNTDVKPTILLSRFAAEHMSSLPNSVHGLPSIINIGWDQAEQGMEGDSGQYFCATKSAIMTFSRSLAKSVGPKVRVNTVAPGWIRTAWGECASEEWDLRAKQESCLGRWGSPKDVAEACFFLASSHAEFINGQTLAVNGGWKHR